uniref:Reverse transcriptase domain-containing protein n=1 Tax=Gouania willdenowi TaxID=441366 RepID=A0A8C5HYQ9_GOUWI
MDEFAELLSVVCTEYNFLIITGDLNIHVDNNMDNTAKELYGLMDTFGLTQHVTGPTHTQGHTLDLIISKGVDISAVDVRDLALSDHFCVFFYLETVTSVPPSYVCLKKRYINENTSAQFMEAIAMTPTLSAETVDDLLDEYNRNVCNVIDVVAPIKTKRKPNTQKTPWRRTEIMQNLKSDCRRAERKWRSTKLQIHLELYKISLRKFNDGLFKARQQYFSEIIAKNVNNSRTLFSVIEKLTTPPDQIAPELLSAGKCNEFAVYFNEKIQSIRSNIRTNQQNHKKLEQLQPLRDESTTMLEFITVNPKTIEETIQQLNPSTCCLDTIPSNFFKTVVKSIVTDLCQIINCSFQSGTVPKSLKVAAVKPLLKKRTLDASILANYRPISNLPFMAKIIEKVVFNQLSQFLTFNKIFDKFQSGFRSHHSTETALIKVINDIRLNTDSGKVSVLILLDLSAAFDTVDHTILLHRLQTWVGLNGKVMQWFKSYLEERSYFVSIGNFESDRLPMSCGVPQGSVLGPLLFNLYMLPLGQILQNCKVDYQSYADDTQLYLSLNPDDHGPIEVLCDCLEKVNCWMSENFLQLNHDKTEVIVFGNKEKRTAVSKYLESRSLKAKDQVKNLGVLIDSDLTFSSQIKSITKTAFYHLKNISRVKGLMAQKDQEKLVHAFISSRLDYCNGLLTGIPQKSIKQLQLVQNAAARVLTRTKRSEHITPVLKSLHWLPVSLRIDFKVLLLVYKSVNGFGPEYISDMLVRYEPSRSLRSMDTDQIVEPRVHSKHGD